MLGFSVTVQPPTISRLEESSSYTPIKSFSGGNSIRSNRKVSPAPPFQIGAAPLIRSAIHHYKCNIHHYKCKIHHFQCNIHHFQCRIHHYKCKIHHYQCKIHHYECNIHHYKCKVHHYQCKIHHFQCKHTAAPLRRGLVVRQISRKSAENGSKISRKSIENTHLVVRVLRCPVGDAVPPQNSNITVIYFHSIHIERHEDICEWEVFSVQTSSFVDEKFIINEEFMILNT